MKFIPLSVTWEKYHPFDRTGMNKCLNCGDLLETALMNVHNTMEISTFLLLSLSLKNQLCSEAENRLAGHAHP
jgi:hypothetical protein